MLNFSYIKFFHRAKYLMALMLNCIISQLFRMKVRVIRQNHLFHQVSHGLGQFRIRITYILPV